MQRTLRRRLSETTHNPPHLQRGGLLRGMAHDGYGAISLTKKRYALDEEAYSLGER